MNTTMAAADFYAARSMAKNGKSYIQVKPDLVDLEKGDTITVEVERSIPGTGEGATKRQRMASAKTEVTVETYEVTGLGQIFDEMDVGEQQRIYIEQTN